MFRSDKIFITLFLIITFCLARIKAQEACTNFIVNQIEITGNEKTKSWVVEFESGLKKGDTIEVDHFLEKISKAQANLKRTGLFSYVQISYILDIQSLCYIDIRIQLTENWLLFPTIILELIDRNANVWWTDFNHDLSRLNYGLGITHYNLTGRREQLKVKLARGFSDKYEFIFNKPYMPWKRNLEMGVKLSYLEYRGISYTMLQSKPLFYEDESKHNSLKKVSFTAHSTSRLNLQEKLINTIEYTQNKILDTITKLNPDYLLNSRNTQRYLKLSSTYLFNTLDDQVRPQNGKYFVTELSITNDFSSFTYVNLNVLGEKVFKITKSWTYYAKVQASTALIRQRPPFNLYSGLGLGSNRIEGYDLYLILGMDYLNVETGIFYKLLGFRKAFFKFLSKEPKLKLDMIFDLFVKVGAARVNDPYYFKYNTLANTNLGSISLGGQWAVNSIVKLDLSYSINHFGESGFYFHTIRAF